MLIRTAPAGVSVVMALAALAGGCASVGTGAVPAAMPTPASVSDARSGVLRSRPPSDGVQWAPGERLTWSDFRGVPEATSAAAAVTTYALAWETACTTDGFSFRVASVFLPEQSWVRASVLDRFQESQRTLAHEQAHFDISEIHARLTRQALSRLSTPCRLTERELAEIVQPIVEADQVMQTRYDRETAHGLNVLQQEAWGGDIARRLRELERYAGGDEAVTKEQG